jgi:hypothetical protein
LLRTVVAEPFHDVKGALQEGGMIYALVLFIDNVGQDQTYPRVESILRSRVSMKIVRDHNLHTLSQLNVKKPKIQNEPCTRS